MVKERRAILFPTWAFAAIALVVRVAPANADDSNVSVLETITVTAEKRIERLQDVPVPLAVVDTQALTNSNQTRLTDYYTTVPGLIVTPAVTASQVISIRGITTGGFTTATVGVVIDDVPFGATKGTVVPDLDPGDLARIEVLRGPQGSLYGASSMGGLLKFVTKDPSFDRLSGTLQAGTDHVYNGAQQGYSVRGAVNVPVTDQLAVYASAFGRQDPGYIDNPVLGLRGVNEAHTYGGHASLLWRPSDAVSLKVNALYQRYKIDGSNDTDVLPGLGDLQQNYLAGIGGSERKVQAYSAVLTAKLGQADLTVLSGYNIQKESDSVDYTYAFGGLAEVLFGNSASPIYTNQKTDKFTQEVRLSMPIAGAVDWLLGGFFTHENSSTFQSAPVFNPTTNITNNGLFASIPNTLTEYAAFTNFTFKLGDRFDIQLGGRESRIKQTFAETETGTYVPFLNAGAVSPYIIPEERSRDNAFTYLLTPRFKLSPDFMVYARLASGYRAGGINATPTAGTPPTYSPDKTQNFEIGLKGDLFDHELYMDVSVYYIDWKDIQLALINPQTQQGYYGTGSRAKSQGTELSLTSRPLRGLTISTWVTFQDAVLKQGLPLNSSASGAAGDRLPNSSRFSGNLSLQQDFPLWENVTGFAGATVSYLGEREGPFGTAFAPQRQILPAYAKTDLRAGLRFNSWTGNLYATNVTDKRGLIAGGAGYIPPFGFLYIQPRTLGLSITKSF